MIDLDNKKKLASAISLYCASILIIIIISQYGKISSVISSILSVFSPIIIGFTISYLLNPILNFYERKVFRFIKRKLPLRLLSMLLTYLSVILFIASFAMLVIPQVINSITDLAGKIDVYIDSASKIIDNILLKLTEINILTSEITSETVLGFIENSFSFDNSLINTVISYIANHYQKIIIIPKNILLGVFISIYVLLTKERIGAQVKKFITAVFNKKHSENIFQRISKTRSTFGGYFTGVILDAIFVGIASFVLCLIFRIPYASLISVILAVTNVIPIFGPFIGTIPSAFIIFISEPNKVIIFIILVIILQQIDGNIVAPKILGDSTGMSSLGVIVAITIMGSCFGFFGMLVGVPVFAVIVTMIKELVDERLIQKEFSANIAEYLPKDSMVDLSEKHISVWQSLFGRISMLYSKIFKKENSKTRK